MMVITIAPKQRAMQTCRRLFNHSFSRVLSVLSKNPSRYADTPFHLAVVGSGPAGFYTAYRVLSKLPQAKVDMYEALPVPFGLVRHGVAPDHPEVKNCQEKFDEVASSPRFRFVGNVSVGSPGHLVDHCTVPLKSLMSHYHSVLLAYGASEDKKLNIPGETTLGRIYSARQFVGWYNGLPDCSDLSPDLTKGSDAVIIGQGNVALDVARVLLGDIDVLKKTDIAEHALAQLAKSQVRRVHVVGRRGPMQATFTTKEVRELMKLPMVGFHPVNNRLIPSDFENLSRTSRRLLDVILKGTPTKASATPKSWSLHSCLSPRGFISSRTNPSVVGSTAFDLARLSDPFNPNSSTTLTGDVQILPSDVVFRSIGYKSTALSGFEEVGIRFDKKRGILVNDGLGRLITEIPGIVTPSIKTKQVPGMYCAGWVKRGPTGVIATTMQDAFITADTIVQDWLSGTPFLGFGREPVVGGWDGMKLEFGPKLAQSVSWNQWRQIDRAEKERGLVKGKTREKFTDIKAMLGTVGQDSKPLY